MRRMVRRTVLALVMLTVAGGGVGAQGKGNGRGKHDDRGKGEQAGSDRAGNHGDGLAVQVTFGRGEVDVVRTHYGDRYRSLPPGLQKKLARTGTLPPGWQKKLEPFPVALERRLAPLPEGYIRGVFDGNAVVVSLRTGMLLDVAVLF